MRVILSESIGKIGNGGDMVNVKPGFARNYLFPRGLAVAADERNRRQLNHKKRVIDQKQEVLARAAMSLKDKIEATSLVVAKRVADQESLYGSVQAKDVELALKDQGIEISRKSIEIDAPIKSLGSHIVKINLGHNIIVSKDILVIAEA